MRLMNFGLVAFHYFVPRRIGYKIRPSSKPCEFRPSRYPEGFQLDAYGLERWGNHLIGIGKAAGLESVGLQRALDRIDQSGVPHPVMGVHR